MSLIDDALRRVQGPLAPKEPTVKAPPAPPQATETPAVHPWTLETPSAAEKKIEQIRWPQLAAALAVFAFVGWIIRPLFMRPVAAPQPKHREATSSPTVASPAAKAPQRPSSQVNSAGPALTGVVIGVGESYAVIDNKIVAKGDRVGDATVKEITETAVTLETPDGGQSVLRVPR